MSLKLRIEATTDLIRRYGAAFRHAWARRAEMQGVARLEYEAEFLPAALSLQETPTSPAPRVAMWMIMGFAAVAVLWAVFGRIDVVASAQGRIVPSDRTKTIQAIETATVKAIHVRDGQAVVAGEVLIELDATTAQADEDRFANDLAVARLQVARAQALLAALEKGRPPALTHPPGVDDEEFQEAQRLVRSQHEEYLAKLSRMEAEIAKREAESRSTSRLVRKFEQTVPIARERAQGFRDLADRDYVSRHDFLEREQILIEQEADLSTQRSRLEEIQAALREASSQRDEMRAELRRVNLDSINEGLQRAAALEQELLKAGRRGQLLTLAAPVDGTVQQLAVHTVGGVVTPAQPIMVIVPGNDPLEVEAFIENRDIGFVRASQDAAVKIETFSYTKYGTIPGEVISVSHDAINDEKRGLVYSARVKMERHTIQVDGTDVNLGAGMAVTVEIKTGKRRVIEYFLSPLLQYRDESLRER